MKQLKQQLVLFIFTSLLLLSLGKLGVEGEDLPEMGIHPLPPSLINWQIDNQVGDYFDKVAVIPQIGYLVWSQFPVKIYVESGDNHWREEMEKAISVWSEYIPLQEIEASEEANIRIWRSPPAPRIERNSETGLLEITRARAGKTAYKLYITEGILSHRMDIEIKPGIPNLLGTATHEIGHALGIWGHSPLATDALYYSQSGQFQGISSRDINTLKKIYQQPTSLGF